MSSHQEMVAASVTATLVALKCSRACGMAMHADAPRIRRRAARRRQSGQARSAS